MSGLTSRQQWTLDHIARCTCGSWVILTDEELRDLHDDKRPACKHTSEAVMDTWAGAA